MSLPRIALLTLAILIPGACSTVVSQQPLGQSADPESAQTLGGDWKAEKGLVRFSPLSDGHMSIQILPPKEGRSAPPPFDVELRRSGDLRYANLHDPDDPEAPGYLFLRYKVNEGGHIVGWIPDTDVFRKAVTSGRLPGQLLGNRISRVILITASQGEMDAFLATIDDDDAWETNHPVVVWNPDAPDTPK
ncbi:MAG: hypothetical protein H6981_07650 [Gammaproteobacteria bacterium]|nr:hypothetical protein [Gammaproteobacteria bacterium]MCP5136658.1 hypothetical protein [Gammaproteobacteria bacterium]